MDNFGIEVIVIAFTIIDKEIKTLLIKNQLKENYLLPKSELGATENCEDCAKRILKELIGIDCQTLVSCQVYSDPYRNFSKREIAVSYLTIINSNDEELQYDKDKCVWFNLKELPSLYNDHLVILNNACEVLKNRLVRTNIASILLPEEFTLPQLQSVYETLLNKKFDRRNFRRKFLSLGLIKATGNKEEVKGHRPAIFYKFLPLGYKEMDIL